MEQRQQQTEAELEQFRAQWRKEVEARSKGKQSASQTTKEPEAGPSNPKTPKPQKNTPAPLTSATVPGGPHDRERDELEGRVYQDLEPGDRGRRLDDTGPSNPKEPGSALEHYEAAVEREREGNLGDSVRLYRRAFKIDADVHEAYKSKQFPTALYKPPMPNPNPSNAPVTVPNPAHHSPDGLSGLLASFAQLSIPPEPAPTELSAPFPCPISTLPEELLVEILLQVALDDVGVFARLSRVCRRLAYLVATEDRIWKRLCLGVEVGFAGMHYDFVVDTKGEPLDLSTPLTSPDDTLLPPPSSLEARLATTAQTTPKLIPRPYPSYAHLLRARPRIRFSGVYISTVNYIRPGAASASQYTWNSSPVLIVTYYRYLRFFRDGSVISLLTTAEPADVVTHLWKENMPLNEDEGGKKRERTDRPSALPNAQVMKEALPGRWRLEGPGEGEGMLHVETEGVVPKYMYKMVFGLATAGRGSRNNKLAWKGYWSYNRLTDDWAEFGLKNDKGFYFSRVRSYGKGV
ncbi:hypothetical protein M501DRAFT_940999 [Patellaria atrata CBS 101060]|uniref:F-box domain-containing protein n=1 Tax=Patellaria atrata CBS 101060 TaxID=1346257 RepID=A0A9P4S437_9PEZI|nr:hypothetical protein M501DRAFT_940999 [Patellaria atrata CBS 101060]